MYAIKSLSDLDNRSAKRKFMHEAQKFAPQLQVIVNDFISAIWTYPHHLNYSDIYNHYLNLWNRQIDSFQNSEVKTIALDRDFFKNNYEPKI